MRCIHQWNYEFIEDSEVVGDYREQIYIDAEMMSRISDRMDCLEGHPIGMPTAKELIAILSKFPEDYRVTCCGAENYLHLFSDKKDLTIDNEPLLQLCEGRSGLQPRQHLPQPQVQRCSPGSWSDR